LYACIEAAARGRLYSDSVDGALIPFFLRIALAPAAEAFWLSIACCTNGIAELNSAPMKSVAADFVAVLGVAAAASGGGKLIYNRDC